VRLAYAMDYFVKDDFYRHALVLGIEVPFADAGLKTVGAMVVTRGVFKITPGYRLFS
jgi:hypothetical protein